MFNKSTFIIRCGRIESRIRRLVTALETRPEILVAHPLIDGVSSEHLGLSYEEIQDVAYNDSIPNRFSSSPINDEVNEKPTNSEGKLYTTKFYIGLLLRRTYGTFGKVFSNLELRIIFNSHFIRHSQNYRLDRSYQTFYPSWSIFFWALWSPDNGNHSTVTEKVWNERNHFIQTVCWLADKKCVVDLIWRATCWRRRQRWLWRELDPRCGIVLIFWTI